MKKIFFSIVALAALAACSKSEVAYEPTDEIGFSVVAGNITKSVVDGNVYPTTLDMYVFAETTDNSEGEANYILNGQFTHRTNKVEGTDVWGGVTPYYWPNVKTLHFAGYSASGNVDIKDDPATDGVDESENSATVTYDCTYGTLSIANYSPGTATAEGANDLMWFPSTELTKTAGYGKHGNVTDKYVSVYMYHTCAWITFIVKGDGVTSGKYTVTNLTMTGIDQTADVTCSAIGDGANYTSLVPTIEWDNNDDKTVAPEASDAEKQAILYEVPVKSTGIVLDADGKDVETDDAYVPTDNAGGNVVVIPQVPGMLNLTYSYTSTTGDTIEETVEGLDLALATNNATPPTAGPAEWLPGKHYIYTITIKANEILIAPSVPVDWADENWNVTVE